MTGEGGPTIEVELLDAQCKRVGEVALFGDLDTAWAWLVEVWPGVTGLHLIRELAASGAAFEWRLPLPVVLGDAGGADCALVRRRKAAAPAGEEAVRLLGAVGDLVDLLAFLNGARGAELPAGAWRSLPTFGGRPPPVQSGALSWDPTHVLVVEEGGGLRLRARKDLEREGEPT